MSLSWQRLSAVLRASNSLLPPGPIFIVLSGAVSELCVTLVTVIDTTLPFKMWDIFHESLTGVSDRKDQENEGFQLSIIPKKKHWYHVRTLLRNTDIWLIVSHTVTSKALKHLFYTYYSTEKTPGDKSDLSMTLHQFVICNQMWRLVVTAYFQRGWNDSPSTVVVSFYS